MGLELTTERYPPIMSQTRYPLRHAANNIVNESKCIIQLQTSNICYEYC